MGCLEKYQMWFYHQNKMQREEREGRWTKTPQLCLFIQVKVFTILLCVF